MTKYTHSEAHGFETPLVRLHEAPGFTRIQLAQELGISRRRIAYCEAQRDHPSAALLQDLARVLNTSIEGLLGSAPPIREAPARSKPKQQLLAVIESFIAAVQNRQGPRS